MEDIREIVRRYIVDTLSFDEDSSTFDDETNLKESGIIDSLAVLRVMTFLEDRFGVQLEVDDLESGSLFSIANIEKLVLSRAEAQRSRKQA